MPKDSTVRPSLPASSSDFALPDPTSSGTALDDPTLILQRFRRPSLLAAKAGHLSDSRLHSPLASSFTANPVLRHGSLLEDAFILRSDSSPSSSSDNATPPLADDDNVRHTRPRHLVTPPRRASSVSLESQSQDSRHRRRLSFPIKQPRISTLLAESRPVENEVKSEAAFQRLIAGSDLPTFPRTPRAPSVDRGRYPEEVDDEFQREDTPSDDGNGDEGGPFAFYALSSGSEPINITKPNTPAGSVNGDDSGMFGSEHASSSSMSMDVDTPSGSPSMSQISCAPSHHWRYTPPPTTTSAVRSNKRKFDDRYDPYSTASKRRAVSPSIMNLRDSHSNMSSPSSRSTPRLPIAIPINIPGSAVSSAASSPTISSYARPMSMTSSPTLRASIGLASPILRPLPRLWRGEEEKEVDGAGEAVSGLNLG
ncbi:hypothetical protein C8J56DRAFT_1000905 [Mycena floridula]|nr:hypothetical protein C8J56DRAFT_1000905 [Mycena floridula]